MSTLVLLVHAAPVAPAYVRACEELGQDVVVKTIIAPGLPGVEGGGLSARYTPFVHACRATGGGSAIAGLAIKCGANLAQHDRVVLATYSAGYGFARGLNALERGQLGGLVLIDSGHGSEGLPTAELAWLVPWAVAARAGKTVLVIGHSDVDPVRYASTTEVAQAAIDRSGGPLAELGLEPGKELGLVRRRREGAFVVEYYDRTKFGRDAAAEHRDALNVWGPSLVAQACALASGLASVDEPIVPDTERPAVRRPGPTAPHGYRCSVAECVADARSLGTWVPAAEVLAGRYVIKPGDAIVSKRLGQNPDTGGRGHIETASIVRDPMRPYTIGGNETDTWVIDHYDVRSPDFLGVVTCDDALRDKLVEVLAGELDAGVHEISGPKANRRIQLYHSGARRGGSPLAGMPQNADEGSKVLGDQASDEVPWCASARSFCVRHALLALQSA